MGTAQTAIPGWLEEMLAGRKMVVAQVPPPPIRATRPSMAILRRALLLLVTGAVGIGASVLLANATGRWWVGVVICAIFAWVGLFLAIGLVGAAKVGREDRARRYQRALEDPIGRLLPNRGSSRGAMLAPASYRGLLALPDRPVLVLDNELVNPMSIGSMGALAPAGHMPEPEVLDVSRFPAGTWFLGLILIFQPQSLWRPIVESFASGAPLVWWNWLGVVPIALGIYLVGRDPWIRRKLGISGLFGRDAVIGAGWLVDERGRMWTVDDTVVLVTSQGTGVEVRLLHADRVHAFYLPVLSSHVAGKGAVKSTRVRTLVAEAVAGGAQAVGLERFAATDAQMPGPDDPLRLLLSSWTYPEPRPDLAMRG